MKSQAPEALAACMGLAWAAANHDLCRHAVGCERRALLVLAPCPEAIAAWVQTRRPRVTGPPVAVCRALNQGPSVSALRADDVLGLLPGKPLTVAKDRDALTPSRATADPSAAARQVERRRKHRATLTPLSPHRPPLRAFAALVAHRRRRVGDNVRRPTRWTRALKTYLPPVLPWFQDPATASWCDVFSRWPTRQAAQRARRPPLERCGRAHHGRSAAVLTAGREASTSAVALTTAAGGITPNVLWVPALVAHRRVPWPAMAAVDPASAPRAQAPPDAPVLDALPGAGAVLAPRRLGACGAPRARDAAAEERPKDAGLAPVTERRAKPSGVHWRLPCPQCLRHTFGAWAAEATRHACWAQGD
jgi:hypothetical protein